MNLRDANAGLDHMLGGEDGSSPIRFRLRDGLPHSYADELPPARMPVQRETRGEYLRAFATFAFLIVSLYALVIIGAATWAIEASR